MSDIPVLDMVFLIIIVLMVIHGYFTGFVEVIFSWSTVTLALLAAVFFHDDLARFVRTKFLEDISYLPEIIAFLAIFLVLMLFLRMLEHVLKDVVKGAKLSGINKILGLVFGIFEGVAISTLILFVLSVQPIFDKEFIDAFINESIFARLMLPVIKIPLQRGRGISDFALLLAPFFPRFSV
jgi:membrane protein required for colicin V production